MWLMKCLYVYLADGATPSKVDLNEYLLGWFNKGEDSCILKGILVIISYWKISS